MDARAEDVGCSSLLFLPCLCARREVLVCGESLLFSRAARASARASAARLRESCAGLAWDDAGWFLYVGALFQPQHFRRAPTP